MRAKAAHNSQGRKGAKLIFKTHLASKHQQKKQVPLLRKRQSAIKNNKRSFLTYALEFTYLPKK
jgi:hypothetical protein